MKYLEFVCGACGGQLVKIKKGRFNRAVYNCKNCKKNVLVECTVCHKPRMLWADEERTICAICYTDFQDGKNNLRPSQVEKIREHRKRVLSRK
ncbi:MAG: hypothetical protein A2Y82_03675 [Candidatus Buchananbacteria bacterium RBG_13_36_9]|uniref:Uncharacterized protein n=1 Tax=Candidatus Buchananbacteria bacterium RBG_13_36_9 TaxID=1797530 RepID=A0A1G1XLZ2_9BACT|nr:MAG: hypothetical protein A2Y82_03675 [Candidatus Buchananbacteria bacterium RBG_13_36_9]